MKKKVLCFDMDGTIANLYEVENWFELLRNENTRPYEIAQPLYDMLELAIIINLLQMNGWKIVVITWGAKGASDTYNKQVAKVKKAWLEKYNFPFDDFCFQEYGTLKNMAISNSYDRQVLVDDNEEVRNAWNGETIDATKDILMELEKLYT